MRPKRGTKKLDKRLSRLYFTPKLKGSLGGKAKFLSEWKYLKPKLDARKVSEWLLTTDTYTLHRPARTSFPRRKTYSSGPNAIWQMDLSDLPELATYNEGYRYILFCIDVFSRFAYAIPLKTKSGLEVTDALKTIITEDNHPLQIQTDKGREFLNRHFQNYLNVNHIHHYTTQNEDIKASIVERLQRTIKSKMFRYFTHKGTNRYINILQDLIHSYNNTYHSTIKMAPAEVNTKNQEDVWHNIYTADKVHQPTVKFKFQVGDRVRISTKKHQFQKGYLPNWSKEIFVISERHTTNPPVYSIKDYSDETLSGTWYEQELQKVKKGDNIYRIEEIIGTRKINGKTQYLVKWSGYPSSMNSYVDKQHIVLNYKN